MAEAAAAAPAHEEHLLDIKVLNKLNFVDLPSWITHFVNPDTTTRLTIQSYGYGSDLFAAVGGFAAANFTPVRVQGTVTRDNDSNLLERLEAYCWDGKDEKSGEEPKSFYKVATDLGAGLHEGTFDGEKILICRFVRGGVVASSGGADLPWNMVVFVNKLGKDAIDLLKKFCEAALKQKETDSEYISIYRFDVGCSCWRMAMSKLVRPINSIFLPKDIKDALLTDLYRFLSKKALSFYVKHGIPYKRSYMFYGRPGTGKTSMIQSIAGYFRKNVAFLQPSNPKMTDDLLKSAVRSAPANSILVLEDIDALFGRDRKIRASKSPLTFSGLLNALDGVGDPDGQIFILTTNFIDRLDPALIRHGRVDLKFEFPLATLDTSKEMFLSFYPGEVPSAEKFAGALMQKFPEGLSMAALQQHFIEHMLSTAEEAAAAVGSIQGDPHFEEPADEPEEKKEEEKKVETKADDAPKPEETPKVEAAPAPKSE
eukprot:TRINITY_DN310_c0_g1_i1.p2 TRINITY_DN310_c0_g1~~TRINITY_DN310_c0_g1_i1.p2  ORF type:complete len:495 (-),score=162.38 TRINITY_DN310_c0_g1_i1:1598-3046(-)